MESNAEWGGAAALMRARLCLGGHNPANDDYFYFNAYGNLESLQYADDANGEVIFPGDIAEYIARTGDDLGNDEIAEILEEE